MCNSRNDTRRTAFPRRKCSRSTCWDHQNSWNSNNRSSEVDESTAHRIQVSANQSTSLEQSILIEDSSEILEKEMCKKKNFYQIGFYEVQSWSSADWSDQ